MAAFVRYMLTPVEQMSAGLLCVEARLSQPRKPRVAVLEIDWHESQERWNAEAKFYETLARARL